MAPQKTLDGRYEMEMKVNMQRAFRQCREQGMNTEEARRYVEENHPATQTFLLNAVEITSLPAMQQEFREYRETIGSVETLARGPRAQPEKKMNHNKEPSFLDPSWYPLYMKTAHMDTKRKEAKNYYKACVLCNSSEHLILHHRHYNSLGRETMADVALLCAECHRRVTQKVLTCLRVPKTPPREVKRLLK